MNIIVISDLHLGILLTHSNYLDWMIPPNELLNGTIKEELVASIKNNYFYQII